MSLCLIFLCGFCASILGEGCTNLQSIWLNSLFSVVLFVIVMSRLSSHPNMISWLLCSDLLRGCSSAWKSAGFASLRSGVRAPSPPLQPLLLSLNVELTSLKFSFWIFGATKWAILTKFLCNYKISKKLYNWTLESLIFLHLRNSNICFLQNFFNLLFDNWIGNLENSPRLMLGENAQVSCMSTC